MKQALLLVALGAALVAVPTASSRSVPIRVGVGIGPINLGMNGQQVSRALGRPRAVIERRVIGGRPYVEFEYQYGAWNIGFLGPKGRRRVVLVGSGLPRHRTPEGVGVGTTETEFWRRVRGEGFLRRRCDRPDPSGSLNSVRHWVRTRGDAETVFFPGGPFTDLEVTGVEVRKMPAIGCAF
jgi:hypothetical protein